MANLRSPVRTLKKLVKLMLLSLGYRLVPVSRPGVDWVDDLAHCRTGTRDLRRIDVIFDVGANIGQTVRELHSRLRPKVVHCFEPVKSTYSELQRNVAKLSGVQCHCCALGNLTGEATINVYEGSVLASLCDSTPIISTENSIFEGGETIAVTTLDMFARNLGIDRIDLLKIDTEGFDLQVLRGAHEMLRSGKIGFILFEFFQASSSDHEAGVWTPIDQLLTAYGYRFLSTYTDFIHPQQPTGVYNALYCKN